MVIDNHKGIEKNFLCSFENFVKNHMANACESYWEVAEMVTELEHTRDRDNAFCEMYFAPNKTMYARFCSGVNELRFFIAGKLNDGMTNVFEEDFCDKECLDVLYRLGISTDRSMAVSKWPHYEKLESDLEQGEIYHNFNGSDYRLMEKYSGRNMLFMDVHSGQLVVGVGVDAFARYPQGEDKKSSLCEVGIEWGSGIYLGNIPSTINFSQLRKEYGIEKTIDTIDDYRASLNERFETYYALAKNEGISDSVREAATNAMYEYIHHDSELSGYEAVEFSDDGFSGANMNRPGMQKLLKEVKANNIICIIVKDMSRFSRDYIEMGTYLNQIFPFMGIRFIAINDHYDSREHHGNTIEIDTAFQTLLYDLYSKDISVKVKASIENKCAKGEYVFGQAPFGYEKSKEIKNAVIVNEKEAEIVRYIFSLAVQGKTSTQIARQLYEENVPTITQMRNPEKKYTDGKVHSWSVTAIRKILNNRFYLGEMAYGKSVRKSVGSQNGIAVPKEDWKVIRNHHEALISEEIYEQVSSFRLDYSTKRNREKHPLTGKLYCGGCGYSMIYKPLHEKNRYRRFECRKHALLQIPYCCTYMNADLLEETVLMMLNKELMLRGNAMKQNESLSSFQRAGIQSLKKKLEECRQEQKQIRAEKDNLYEQYALKAISSEEYQKRSNELTERLSSLSVKESDTEGKLSVLESEYQKAEADMKQIIRYSHIEELTQEVVDTFIRRVYAYKDKRIEIEWNFSMDCGVSQANGT